MSSATKYSATATRARQRIAAKGAAVVFNGVTPRVYDPATDTWTGGDPVDITGVAVQQPGDPDLLRALSLIGVDNVTLFVAGTGFVTSTGTAIVFVPVPGVRFTWANGKQYSAVHVADIAPDGPGIAYTITGSR